jgi:hypothetical protein
MNRSVSLSRSSRRRAARVVGRATALVLAAAASSALATEAPAPAASPAPARPGGKTLPSLFGKDSMVEVRGKILGSSRGHPGPVRLEVEKSDGERIDVLVAPDELCERLGLSLRAGEQVHVRGSLFKGRTPIVVASEVIVDGKEIPVRNRGPAPKATARQP